MMGVWWFALVMLAHVVEQVLQRWLLTCQHAASYKRDAPVNWWKSDSIYNVYFNQQFLQFYSHGHEHEHERKTVLNFMLFPVQRPHLGDAICRLMLEGSAIIQRANRFFSLMNCCNCCFGIIKVLQVILKTIYILTHGISWQQTKVGL